MEKSNDRVLTIAKVYDALIDKYNLVKTKANYNKFTVVLDKGFSEDVPYCVTVELINGKVVAHDDGIITEIRDEINEIRKTTNEDKIPDYKIYYVADLNSIMVNKGRFETIVEEGHEIEAVTKMTTLYTYFSRLFTKYEFEDICHFSKGSSK